MDEKFIGIFGMMGSGKSVIINEYLIERPHSREAEFTPPPVEAKFRGMDFEFVDQIFALEKNGSRFNFYELDAPTINKWTQFIGIADAIIIAYNAKKTDYFESAEKFISNIKEYSSHNTPLFFVVNNCENRELAKSKLEEVFEISKLEHNEINIINIPPAEMEYTKNFGRRTYVDISILDDLYSSVLRALSN